MRAYYTVELYNKGREEYMMLYLVYILCRQEDAETSSAVPSSIVNRQLRSSDI